LKEAAFYYQQAVALLKTHPGYQEKKFGFLRKIKAVHPYGENNLYQNLGSIYLQGGKYREAREAFQDLVRIDSENIEGYQGLGKAFLLLGEFQKAVQAFQGATRLGPKNEAARKNLEAAQIALHAAEKN